MIKWNRFELCVQLNGISIEVLISNVKFKCKFRRLFLLLLLRTFERKYLRESCSEVCRATPGTLVFQWMKAPPALNYPEPLFILSITNSPSRLFRDNNSGAFAYNDRPIEALIIHLLLTGGGMRFLSRRFHRQEQPLCFNYFLSPARDNV